MAGLANHPRLDRLRASAPHFAHGTRARYMGGCRCLPCRAANSRYAVANDAARRAGITNRIVSSEPARVHLEALAHQGIGRHSIAAASGVSATIVAEIKSGRRPQIREDTQRRLLAVDRAAIADHAIVPAGPTWNRLDHLIQAGYSKTQLAAWMGHRSIQLKRTFVTARNASRVERLYTLIQDGRLTRGDNRKVV